jgi:hypothetical protein
MAKRSTHSSPQHHNALSLANPGVTRRNVTGKVSGRLESARLRVARKRMWLSTTQAVAYQAAHTARPFFDDLVKFMTYPWHAARHRRGVCPFKIQAHLHTPIVPPIL